MVSCSVLNCNVTYDNNPKKYLFHRFPVNPVIKLNWVNVINKSAWSLKGTISVGSHAFAVVRRLTGESWTDINIQSPCGDRWPDTPPIQRQLKIQLDRSMTFGLLPSKTDNFYQLTMDINEDIIKEEVSSFVASLQKLLPKKKEFILIEKPKPKLIRLSDVHVEAKSVFPTCFTGAKLVVLRDILDKVKLVQQYNYGRTKESYKCFNQLIHKEMEPKNAEEGLIVDSSGSATATYTEIINGSYQMRLTSKIKDLVSSETEVVVEREHENSVGSISCCVKDVNPNTLRFVTQWTYKIVPDFSVGTELCFRPVSLPAIPDLSLSARYEKPSFTISSTVTKRGFQACIFKQFAPDLRIATIVNERTQGPTTVGVALHKKYHNGSELKIFVDSLHCGGFTFQKDILFQEEHNEIRVLRVIGSTLIDKQKRVRFGFGINMDF